MTPEESRISYQQACTRCGAFVTSAFARVFGDNDDRVHGCPECLQSRDLEDGGSARPERRS